jgi:hypothetical protein
MEDIEKPHTDKYKEIMNDWNYDASCTLTSLPVWDLENFKCLVFVVQSVQNTQEPEEENNIFLLFQCLVFIELPYSEDMREFVFPPIVSDNNKPTKEQLDSIDALIDNMDLQAVKFVHFFKYFGILLIFANKTVI